MNEQRIDIDNILKVGTILHGVYRIEDYLSSGGFGNTYVAINMELAKLVAIKEFFIKGVTQRDADNSTVNVSNTYNRTLFQEQLQKFKKEARRISKLKSQHIVTVYDLFEENGTAYYVMEYIDGVNLSVLLKRLQKPLSETEVMGYLPQILDALECVHQEGLYHLDLKPANIMVDRKGNITLIDFGASKQHSSAGGATSSTAVSYTNGYAPREQMEQNLDKFGPWTDIYALGATLYNLLTNKRPPLPSDIDDDLSSDKHHVLPIPANVSRKTKQLILNMLATNRLGRPQSVEQVRRFVQESISEQHQQDKPEIDDESTINADSYNNIEETVVTENNQDKKGDSLKDANQQKKENNKKKNPWIVEILTTALVLFAIVVYRLENAEVVNGIQKDNDSSQSSFLGDNKKLSQDEERVIIDNLISNMVHVAGGTFTMGATSEQGSDAESDEEPSHQVKLSSFSIGRYEVTQEEWRAVMDSNPSCFQGDKRPVEGVSWNDCQEFIRKLNEMTGKHFRLPTEAEWEFAARGGNSSQGFKYAGSNNIDFVAWFEGNSGNETHPVGQKQPNELGLYDMSGNVWEWCSDNYGSYPSYLLTTNPSGPSEASSDFSHVIRGGSLFDDVGLSRVSCRDNEPLDSIYNNLGLRLAL